MTESCYKQKGLFHIRKSPFCASSPKYYAYFNNHSIFIQVLSFSPKSLEYPTSEPLMAFTADCIMIPPSFVCILVLNYHSYHSNLNKARPYSRAKIHNDLFASINYYKFNYLLNMILSIGLNCLCFKVA